MLPASFAPSGWAERIDRDSLALRNWLGHLDGGQLAYDAIVVVQDERWESFRAALEDLFDLADAVSVDALGVDLFSLSKVTVGNLALA